MASVQGIGATGLVFALIYPIVALQGYFHPKFEISVENRASEMIAVWAETSEDGGCADWKIVQPGESSTVHLGFTSYDCWGKHATTLKVNRGFGSWKCDWTVAKSHEPLVITDHGPDC